MKIPTVVVLGAALIGVLFLSLGRDETPSDSVLSDSTVREAGPTRSDQLDSIRAVRAAVRKRIADSDTYLGFVLAEDDSVLKRWQDRTISMLKMLFGGRSLDGSESVRYRSNSAPYEIRLRPRCMFSGLGLFPWFGADRPRPFGM